MNTPRVVEAVCLGHKPGRNTIKADVRRAIMRAFVWLLHRSWIPLAARHRAMFAGLRFSQWATGFRLAGGSKGNTFENDLLKLIFNATAIANIADNASASPLTSLYASLHTSDPGEAGDQTTSEATYTSYARVGVLRQSGAGGFTVTANSVSPQANISFPAGTGGSGTVTYAAIGTASSGAGKLLYSGTVTPNIVTGNGITPVLTTASTFTED